MKPFRLLVTGSRHTTPQQSRYITRVLDALMFSDRLNFGHRPIVVVHGQCPYGGVDLAAHEWAVASTNATPEPHPADWAEHGSAAGPIRNAFMVSLGADLCYAFPDIGSRGTWDCAKKASDARIMPEIFPLWQNFEEDE